jgi:trans-2,3-dihydro-3-hydroxyanthranilate isomerase
MPYPAHIVDVFAEERLAGNQLAVVLDANDLGSDEMQRVAREMNFSETTFVASGPDRDGAWPVRIFTPSTELPFAGHPTLGTAWVIRRHLLAESAKQVDLALGVGRVPVRFEPESGGDEVAWLTAPRVELGPILDPGAVAAAVGLSLDDLDPRTPARRLTAGPCFVFARVSGQQALRRVRLDVERLTEIAPGEPAVGIYLFCAESTGDAVDLAARMVFDADGPREDPATGSATAMLGAYLLEHDAPAEGEISLRIEQGVSMQRPSLLRLTARRTEDGGREIRVGGRVVPVVRGELL